MATADRSAWLAAGAEAALDPDLAICDPHHHLWIYPDSRYLVEECLADFGGGHRVRSSVFVECLMFYREQGPEELRPVGETEYVARISAACQGSQTRLAAGIVGFADLRLGDAVRPVLEAHMAASTRFRGIRFATAWDASEKVHNAHTRPVQGLMGDSAFRAGLKCLESLGLRFDAWLYFPQIPELADLASAFPELPIVLDHVGGPIGIGPYAGRRDEVFGQWRNSMERLARFPNIRVKLGGLAMTMAGFGWHKRSAPPSSLELAEAMNPYFQACIELFGVERCMFESNFPVDGAACSYTVLWNAFKRVTQDFSNAERQALLHDNAVRFYALD